jgi:mRNA-degrading endonuclease RelE of RelBE toxin-antitoxin system
VTIIMVMSIPYRLVYAPQVKQHLKAIEPKYFSLIRTKIETQLRLEPAVETRNRKPLRQQADFEGEWELRFGPENQFRVFYRIDIENHEVQILAIGVKKGNRLFIGGEEVEL